MIKLCIKLLKLEYWRENKMKKTLALVIADGRLDLLSKTRSKAALPFAGKFRLIDFTLSNCINSGIEDIGIVTQYLPNSLKKHLGIGKPWDLDRQNGGITVLQPFKGPNDNNWFLGNAQALYKNLSYIKQQAPEEILVLPGNLVYKMNYQKILNEHRKNKADLTIAANNIPYTYAKHYSILDYKNNNKVISIKEQKKPAKNLISMGVFVFQKDVLIETLKKHCSKKAVDFEKDIIPKMLAENKDVYLSRFEGHWRSIRTFRSYWKGNLEITEDYPDIDLYDNNWPIFTRSEEKPPVKFGANSSASKSLISNGAIINGHVENSVISPGVYIEEGALVKNSVILNNCTIRKNSLIDMCIFDKNVEIEENVCLGYGNNFTKNKETELELNGLNLVAKDVTIEKNIKINRNCRINKNLKTDEFKNNEIKSGKTID